MCPFKPLLLQLHQATLNPFHHSFPILPHPQPVSITHPSQEFQESLDLQQDPAEAPAYSNPANKQISSVHPISQTQNTSEKTYSKPKHTRRLPLNADPPNPLNIRIPISCTQNNNPRHPRIILRAQLYIRRNRLLVKNLRDLSFCGFCCETEMDN
jgi:hypothetical protein